MRIEDIKRIVRAETAFQDTWISTLRNAGDPVAQTRRFGGGIGSVKPASDKTFDRVYGLALDGPAEPAVIDEAEAWYRDAGQDIRIEVSPVNASNLMPELGARGYTMDHIDQALGITLADRPVLDVSGDVTVRDTDDAEHWCRVVGEGMGETAPDGGGFKALFRALDRQPGARMMLAFIDGEPAGGGMFSVHDGIALLHAASTRPAMRRRGVQLALLDARLAEAQRLGCALAAVQCGAFSASERNIRRAGFGVLFSQLALRRGLAD